MKIDASSYPEMRAWFALVTPRIFPNLPADIDPVAVLERTEAISMARARKGLSLAIGDIIELTSRWSVSEMASIDAELTDAGLPTLSTIRLRFSKAVGSIIRRGRIQNEAEYYLVRNAADVDAERRELLFGLLDTWEASLTDP